MKPARPLLAAGLIATLIGLPAAAFVARNPEALLNLRTMAPAYEAKEMCSCLWVEGRDREACDAFVAQDIVPIDQRVVDEQAKTVRVTALWTTREARWISERAGCAHVVDSQIGDVDSPSGPDNLAPVALVPGVPWMVDSLQAGGSEPGPPERPGRFPGQDWDVGQAADHGFDLQKLAELEQWAFARQGDEIDRKGMRTDALILVRHGRIVFERYARGATKERPSYLWSITRGVAAALVGVAVQEGRLDLNAPVATYVPEMRRGRHARVRITDLLRTSTGVQWTEGYEYAPVFSSAITMLYTAGRSNMGAYAASRPLAHPPGTYWQYEGGSTNLLMLALKNTMSDEAYAQYPWTAMLDRIGVRSATWERDGAGVFVGYCYLYMSPRDLARWAMLLLQDGVWDGQRLLPEGWVRYMTELAPAFRTTAIHRDLREQNPGAHLYLNVGDPARGLPEPYPGLPKDLFGGMGHWGKRVWVIPSLDLIVVRTGDDRDRPCSLHIPDDTDCVADPDAVYDDAVLLKKVISSLVR